MSHLGGHLFKTHVDLGTFQYLYNTENITSMIDVGCGPGGMLNLAKDFNIYPAIGIDGDDALVPYWKDIVVIQHDFRNPIVFDLPEVDLIWSVEFLEHVEEEYQNNYFEVIRKGKLFCGTAAPPSAPGHHHVNCKPLEYWIERFDEYGFYYDKETTEIVKKVSSMKKPFMQQSGMIFRRYDGA